MTTYSSGTVAVSAPPVWVRVLLGIVLMLAGVFVLGDVAMATLISAIFIGAMAIVGGAFEIVHAFWTKGWGGFFWQLLLGALYVAAGIVLVSQPASGALILTLVLGLMLLISGFVRIVLSVRFWQFGGWVMLVSGIFGVLAGLVILSGFPATGLWVLGFVLGIDLIMHGVAWFTYAWLPAARTA
jgi:uncharacterized membrane protein HdeD (DUF308 family)